MITFKEKRILGRDIKGCEKGITLIELLIAMAIFSLVLGSSISLLETGIKAQRQVLNMGALSDNLSYVMEYMSRTIRMAKKDKTGSYITPGCNFATTSNSGLKFINSNLEEHEFFLDNGILKESKDGSVPTALTSSNFKITELHFYLLGECQGDDIQPRVTVAMEIETRESDPQTLNIQTSISQRDLDITY